MLASRRWLPLLALCLPASLEAQVPAGPAFVVNTQINGSQYMPRVAAGPGGEFVVVWCDEGHTVHGRIYDASTAPIGPDFRVSTPGGGCYESIDPPAVGAASWGFVALWIVPGSPPSVSGQRFAWSGQRLGSEFRVNSPGIGAAFPAAAMGPGGEFTIAWASSWFGTRIYGRRFDAQGNPMGAEFLVESSTTGYTAATPAAAAAQDGRVVVVWWRSDGHVVGRLFGPSGLPLGPDFPVSVDPTANPRTISTAFAGTGGFIVVWGATGDYRVHGRVFDALANPLSGEFVVSADPVTWEKASAAPYGRDRYVVTWAAEASPPPPAPFPNVQKWARVYGATGAAHAEFAVATRPEYWQMYSSWPSPQVATDAVGNMAFAWARPMDGWGPSELDILGRRFYGGLIPQGPAVDPVAGPSSDGNGVLEACETVAFRPGWRNDTGATETVSGTLTSFTGPAGATYTIVDGSAVYGTIPDGGAASCTSDCHSLAVSCASPRLAAHWDANLVETLAPVPQRGRFALHVGESFQDVPRTSPFYRFVETLLHRGVTAGCDAAQFCPGSPVTREQMAVFVLEAKEDEDFVPYPCVGGILFPDVGESNPACPHVQAIARRGIAAGCGGGLFCPSDPVTREQMAVFVLRTLDPELSPPACTTPMFADVPASSLFCRWVEELARRGVVTGCGGGNYCPVAPVTREQMAVFLGVSFGLTLYGP